MPGKIDERLAALGLSLPAAATPAFNYVPFTAHGATVFVAGQIPQWEGQVRHVGRLGAGTSLEEAQAAARLCALNVLAQVRAACAGDLDRVERFLRLGVFVSTTPECADAPKVANGASDLLVEVFGEAGRHARTTVGVASLPLGVVVEIDAIVALRG
ncbi:MAG: RidA family protein [Planctomycetes bacterium]|nr:RidA family protein [Planctomycetota bacterium]